MSATFAPSGPLTRGQFQSVSCPPRRGQAAFVLMPFWHDAHTIAVGYRERDPEVSLRWLLPIAARLRDIMSLPEDWNSYGASVPSVQALAGAVDVLGRIMDDAIVHPTIVPTPSGGIQLEWHESDFDIEIYVDRRGAVRGLVEEYSTHEDIDGTWVDIEPVVRRLLRVASALQPAATG